MRRKNFLPILVIAAVFWSLIAVVVYFIEPETFGIIPLFFVFLFFALFFTSSLIFGDKRRGLFVTSGATLFVILRFFGVGNILNLLLIAALLITTEVYLAKR